MCFFVFIICSYLFFVSICTFSLCNFVACHRIPSITAQIYLKVWMPMWNFIFLQWSWINVHYVSRKSWPTRKKMNVRSVMKLIIWIVLPYRQRKGIIFKQQSGIAPLALQVCFHSMVSKMIVISEKPLTNPRLWIDIPCAIYQTNDSYHLSLIWMNILFLVTLTQTFTF